MVIAMVMVTSKRKAQASPPPLAPAGRIAIPAAPVSSPVTPMAKLPVTTTAPAAPLRGEAREEYIRNRAEELMDLARQSNSAAHLQIVAELNNPDRAIRQAALEALEQADARSMIPEMRQKADAMTDPDDQQAVMDAIQFIETPSITELMPARATRTASGDVNSTCP